MAQNGKVHNGGVIDPAFVHAGKKPGLEIWRVEKLQLVTLKQTEHGKFYNGDAYIVLSTSAGSPPSYHIHFWLGTKSSIDESTVAAYKTVELDELFHGAAIQHREVEEHESKQFLSYFKTGIRILEGGIDSGLNRVVRDQYEKRLYQVKGRRNCHVHQVELSKHSLNKNDVFVLDDGLNIYVWNGPTSNKVERIKGAEVARDIRDNERDGRAFVHLIDDDWDRNIEFFKALGSSPGGYDIADHVKDDEEHERRISSEVRLFKLKVVNGWVPTSIIPLSRVGQRVSDASGRMETVEIEQRPLNKKMLDTKDCFILDLGPSGVYAWIGKNSCKDERQTVWKTSTDFLKSRGYPKWTPIEKMNEGAETAVFKQSMHFPPEILIPGDLHIAQTSHIAKIDSSAYKVDLSKLHKRVETAHEYMPDGGHGEKQIWRVENMFLRPVDKLKYGTFYSGDSYVILYKFRDANGSEKGLVYFWQGLHSSADEKAASAMLSTSMDSKELHGRGVTVKQIRVVQNKEPKHFLEMFRGNMVVLMGGHRSGFKNRNEKDTYDTDGIRLFQIRDTRINQVVEKASSLNSNDIFILETPKTTFIWYGKGANEEEKAVAKGYSRKVVQKTPLIVEEGHEPAEFWAALGGKAKYATGGTLNEAHVRYPARLFECTNKIGYFKVEEIVNFVQEDLFEDDVMLLDTFDEIFVWIGDGSNSEERKESMKVAMDYLKTDVVGRSVDETPLLVVKQGYEPPTFTGHFPSWDPNKWSQGKSYEELKHEIIQTNSKVSTVTEALKIYDKKYPFEIIAGKQLPEGVHPVHKENNLLDTDFEKHFHMTRSDFMKLPQWKKTELKKKIGLF